MPERNKLTQHDENEKHFRLPANLDRVDSGRLTEIASCLLSTRNYVWQTFEMLNLALKMCKTASTCPQPQTEAHHRLIMMPSHGLISRHQAYSEPINLQWGLINTRARSSAETQVQFSWNGVDHSECDCISCS